MTFDSQQHYLNYTTGQHMSHMFLKRVVFSSAVAAVIRRTRPPRICSILFTSILFYSSALSRPVCTQQGAKIALREFKENYYCVPYMNKDLCLMPPALHV